MSDLPPPPPPPPAGPPPGLPPYPMQPPPAVPSPGYMPQPIGPTSGTGINFGYQLRGARASIGLGAVSIVVPIITALLFNGSVFYFYVLPIFGLLSGVGAVRRGFVIGGIVGIVLNVLGGLISLTAAGIINPGS